MKKYLFVVFVLSYFLLGCEKEEYRGGSGVSIDNNYIKVYEKGFIYSTGLAYTIVFPEEKF